MLIFTIAYNYISLHCWEWSSGNAGANVSVGGHVQWVCSWGGVSDAGAKVLVKGRVQWVYWWLVRTCWLGNVFNGYVRGVDGAAGANVLVEGRVQWVCSWGSMVLARTCWLRDVFNGYVRGGVQ
jgi:hypothetical protein